MSLVDDNSSEDYGGMFENGHWDWDEEKNELIFISHADEDVNEITLTKGAHTGTVHFKDDIDFHDQLRFKNRYQRKVKFGQREVVTLQDVKDVAIFTAPTNFMSEMLINMLHRPTTERFIRALILYCQYYLQIVEVMENRKKSLDKTVRTPQSDEIENEYRDNLCDLRLLVAKQYCTITIGSCDMKRYHHMGAYKRQSLSHRDAHLWETFIRICVQIVYIALGRVSYNLIETEVNRLFKTERFNTVERNHPIDFITYMTPEDRNVFLSHCLRNDTKFRTCSPMVDEVFCHRYKDYRLLSLADVKHDKLSPRLRYLQQALAAAEENFETQKTVVGILGLPRTRFDTSYGSMKGPGSTKKGSLKDEPKRKSTKISQQAIPSTLRKNLFADIVLPPRDVDHILPESFPEDRLPMPRCNLEQRDRWINRLIKMYNARRSIKSCYTISSRF
ncbi:hypothetical protein O0L34_g8792 [Tuta absoluta]|nr:hypothetical protein O0L34_g8792 [Tuta absoluta]